MNHSPQRVVSLQPSVTLTLAELGLLDRVVACTKYCADVCPEVREGKQKIIHDSWTTKADEFTPLHPDLVIASVPYQLESVAEIIKAGVPFLALAPHSLEDVYKDIALIAGAMGVPERAAAIIARMQSEITALASRRNGQPRPRVYCEEWGKPLIHSQSWVKELTEAAGGEFVGTPGAKTTPEEVAAADPDVIVAAWCGAGDRVPLEKIVRDRDWQQLRAVRDRRIYCIADEYLNTPATTLLHGLRALAWCIAPDSQAQPEKGVRRIAQ